VVGARLAERMNVSPPAVTQALRRLARDGLVTVEPRHGAQLTPEGRRLAETTLRRHYLVERLLVDVLGLNWAEVHQEADRIEHALSPELEQHLFQRLGRPTTCPHGNPFPGAPEEKRLIHARALTEAHPGESVTLLRVTEEAEQDAELMRFLLEHLLFPGARLAVLNLNPTSDILTLRISAEELQVPMAYARKLRISGLSPH
jgi:DtxR family Mn-dependent transcriptional regulator